MHGYVVFDNNAYQATGSERLDRIMAAERAQGVHAMANLTVLQEMLAQARQPKVRDRGRDRSGIKKLGRHCRVEHEYRVEVRFITHVEGQVYRALAGEQHPRDGEMFDAFADMVRVVSHAESDDPLDEIADDLTQIEELVTRQEASYVEHLAALIDVPKDPNPMRRNLDFATEIATRTQKMYGRAFSPMDILQRIIDIAKISSLAFALRDAVVAEVRAKRGGYAQHANTLWDEQVVCSTSTYSTLGGQSVLLVTEEPRLHDAAHTAGAADLVCSLADYERLLGLAE